MGWHGSGKSTVLKNILDDKSLFRSDALNVAVVEADALKEGSPRARIFHFCIISLLVTALNEGLDVILDTTSSWEPYVTQTIAMAREVHKHRRAIVNGRAVRVNSTEFSHKIC
ncbi:hypothetical protein GmHk_17G048942 [Glycine max]|nr:hypothetical protein GmHk_17G048942 [Glycine max]KAH1202486.1 hypothetical protein GmHk_17G048942 [Glycine max]